jgi:HlyD family secretion protein
MSRKPWLLVPLLLAALGAAGYYFLWPRVHPEQEPGRLTLYGNVDIREARLSFNASEHVDRILVQEGDRVTKGQLLAVLHRELMEAEREQAAALVEAQRQVVAKLESGARPEEIDKARADLEAARARARSARDTWQRLERLAKKKLASPEEVENARSAARAAEAQVKAAEAALRLLLAGSRKEDIAAARAELAARKAALRLAERRLAETELRAPADGVIRDRILEPGDMASPQTPVLTLALLDPVWVRAYLPEPMLGRVRPGMRADILTDSHPGKRYAGWVGYISPTAEFTPKNVETPELRTRLVYQVRVFACNPRGELRLGMPATVEIDLEQPPDTERPPCPGKP